MNFHQKDDYMTHIAKTRLGNNNWQQKYGHASNNLKSDSGIALVW